MSDLTAVNAPRHTPVRLEDKVRVADNARERADRLRMQPGDPRTPRPKRKSPAWLRRRPAKCDGNIRRSWRTTGRSASHPEAAPNVNSTTKKIPPKKIAPKKLRGISRATPKAEAHRKKFRGKNHGKKRRDRGGLRPKGFAWSGACRVAPAGSSGRMGTLFAPAPFVSEHAVGADQLGGNGVRFAQRHGPRLCRRPLAP